MCMLLVLVPLHGMPLAQPHNLHQPLQKQRFRNQVGGPDAKRYMVVFKNKGQDDSACQHDRFRLSLENNPMVFESQGYKPFKRIFSGMVVDVNQGNGEKEHEAALNDLSSLPEVKHLLPVMVQRLPKIQIHQSHNVQTNRRARRDNGANNLTFVADILSSNSGQNIAEKGSGVKVCTVDTGIDYTHPALGGCFGPACKVAFGYDFVGDNYDPSSADPTKSVPQSDNDPMDCAGHGTHVAGIIAATDVQNRGATGIAPAAQLGAYRVFGCKGTTDNAIIVSAIEMALNDGCDILNLSLGGSASWFDTPDSDIATAVSQQGMIVVSAVGNGQSLGVFQIGSPAVSKMVTSVAAVENTIYWGRTMTLLGDSFNRSIPFSFTTGHPPSIDLNGFLKASEPLSKSIPDDGCDPFAANYFNGYIALIRRGTCLFTTKIINAYNAGATAIVIYNRQPGSIGEIPSPIDGFQVLTVSGVDGEYIVDMLIKEGNGKVEALFGQRDVVFAVPGAGLPTDFTSWGPSPDFDIKPEISAPGGHIFSTWPVNLGGYADLSGTSMSCPMISGIYALTLARNGQFSPKSQDVVRIKNILLSTAHPVTLFNTTNHPLAPVALQGAGLVNALAAARTTTELSTPVVSTHAIPWDEKGVPRFSTTFNITLYNISNNTVNYQSSVLSTALVAIDDPTMPIIFPEYRQTTLATVSPPSFTLGPYQNQKVRITIRGPSRAEVSGLYSLSSPYGSGGRNSSMIDGSELFAWLYGGYIPFVSSCGSQRVQVSFSGVTGIFTNLPILDTVKNVPYLTTYFSEPASAPTNISITIGNSSVLEGGTGNMLIISLHLLLPGSNVSLSVFPVISSRTDQQLLNSAITAFSNKVIPSGSAAFISGIRLPISSADPTNPSSMYSSVTWDGTKFFDGVSPLVSPGIYQIAVVAEGSYGSNGSISGWLSSPFTVFVV